MGSGCYGGCPKGWLDALERLANEFNIPGINGRVLLDAKESCGLKAIVDFWEGNTGSCTIDTLFEWLSNYPDLFIDVINKVNSTGLHISDIANIVETLSKQRLRADMRYASHVREMTGYIFRTDHRGIAALKLISGSETQWIAFNTTNKQRKRFTMEELKSKYPNMDGIGHVVVFRLSVEFEAMNNTHSNKCEAILCDICGRKDFCFEKALER